jgi:large conductance mechanosensitive channel
MISEFKEFAMKGNLVDMAVGFVMGSAFATVVSSFIADVFMPAIGPLLGGLDLASAKYTIEAPTMAADGVTVADPGIVISYGNFLVALISFLIVALVMFLIIKGMNKAMPEEEEAPAGPTDDQKLLTDIRDLLAAQNAKG